MDDLSDEELMLHLAAGDEGALAPLHSRYASLIFNLAAQSLDRPAAEEIVQDVFVAIWRRADSYDPDRGPVRPWLLQIARLRVLNELRRRGRRPTAIVDPEGERLAAVPDQTLPPEEAAWHDFRREAVHEAVAALPPPQRQALSLAFFDDLTHEQIAAFLGVPLGTTKTRIRSGMQKLRPLLVTVLVLTLAFTGAIAALIVREQRAQEVSERQHDALAVIAESNSTEVRLTAAPGVPADTHGHYRTAPGADLGVLTLSHFAPAPAGKVYQVWAHDHGAWHSLGIVHFDSSGYALLIVDQRDQTAPDALKVTLQSKSGSDQPTGPVVVAWSSQ
jgi:RNA polymerase sigma-70 factor (ECF subfamily)